MATEDVLIKINVDGSAAKRELDEIRASATSFSGAAKTVAERLSAMRKAQLDLASAIASASAAKERDTGLIKVLRAELDSTTASLNKMTGAQQLAASAVAHTSPFIDQGIVQQTNWRKQIGAAKEHIEKQAGAIAALTVAFGSHDDALGKAVRSVGGLAGAYGAGGGLGVALAAAGMGVNMLTEHWENLIRVQDEALAQQYAGTDALTAQNHALEARLNALKIKVEPETAAKAYLRVQKEIDEATKLRDRSRNAQNNRDWVFLNKRIEMLKEIQRLEAVEIAKKSQAKAEAAMAGERFHTLGEVLRMQGSDGDGGIFKRALAEQQKLDAELRKMEEENNKADLYAYNEEAAREHELFELKRKNAEDLALIEADAAWQAAFEYDLAMQSIKESTLAVFDDALLGSLNNATGALAQFFNDWAAGQDFAAERAVASFLSSTGTQLVGIGTKALWEGAVISANPITPGAGLPMMGIGAGAIAAGIAMGAGGAAISASLPSGGGGGVRDTLADSAGSAIRDRGPNHRNTGGSGGSYGQRTVIINYAVGGPQAEDVSRELARLDRVRERRGMR